MRLSTALGHRSMVRMGPVVRATENALLSFYVIPEGAGTVKSFDQGCGAARILLIWLSLLGGRREAARRRGHGGAPAAQRGRTTLRPSRAGRRMGGEGDGLLGGTSFGWVSRGDAAPSPATAGPGQPRARVPVIPSPRRAAWSCAAAAGRAQSSGRPRRQAGVMTNASARPGCARAVHIVSVDAAARQRTWPSRRP
jgi:hypothetical protein